MSTGQIRRFAYAEADDVEINDQPVARGSYGEWLWWYEPGRYRVALDLHPAFSHHLDLALHRQVPNGVVQYGRDLCRT